MTDPIERPAQSPPTRLAVYGLSGKPVAGDGPGLAGPLARAALTGTAGRRLEGGRVTLVVPVVNNEEVVAVLEASVDESEVWGKVLLTWGLLACGVVVTLAIGVVVARLQTRALVRPLDDLIKAAAGVREGDLSSRAQPSQIPELDQLAQSHNEMVAALAENLEVPNAIAVDFGDEGSVPPRVTDPFVRGVTTGAGAGLGLALALARTMASSIDGRLILARREPTVFTLFVPDPR